MCFRWKTQIDYRKFSSIFQKSVWSIVYMNIYSMNENENENF